MKASLLFFLTIGEWLEQNALGIIVAFVGWLSSAAVLIWNLSTLVRSSKETAEKVDRLTDAIDKQSDDLHSHVADTAVHTTFEQRQAINARFDRIESGNDRIEDKLDSLIQRFIK